MDVALSDLFGDGVRRLDDLGCDPGQGATLRGDPADVGFPLLLGEAKVGNLADGAPIAVAQQQIGAL